MRDATGRKKSTPDQINIWLGSEDIKNFNTFMETHGGKKVDFIRDALNFWMLLHQEYPDDIGDLKAIEQKIKIIQRQLDEAKKSCEELSKALQKTPQIKYETILELKKEIIENSPSQYTAQGTVAEKETHYQKKKK